jgi:hypothetical protein
MSPASAAFDSFSKAIGTVTKIPKEVKITFKAPVQRKRTIRNLVTTAHISTTKSNSRHIQAAERRFKIEISNFRKHAIEGKQEDHRPVVTLRDLSMPKRTSVRMSLDSRYDDLKGQWVHKPLVDKRQTLSELRQTIAERRK